MNISPSLFAAFIVLLVCIAWWRQRHLYLAFPVVLLVFPTTRTMLGPVPVYWYDATMLLLLLFMWLRRDLRAWPREIPRWHWWFILVGFAIGTLLPLLRYGVNREIFWIFGHATLAWLAFPVAMALHLAPAPQQQEYRHSFTHGMIAALLATATIAMMQFGNAALAGAVNDFYFGDMPGHLKLANEMGAILSSERANGPYGDPNTFGGTSALAGTATLLLLADRSRKLSLLALGATAVVVAATVSRQVLVAASVGLFVAALIGTANSRIRILGAAILIAAIVLAGGFGENWGNRLAKWEGGLDKDVNVVGRTIIGPKRLLSVIEHDPSVLLVGVGLDVQKLAQKSEGMSSEVDTLTKGFVSNSFLLSLYYLGVFGFSLMLAFWVWTLSRASRMPLSVRPQHVGAVVMAIILIASDNYAFNVEVSVSMLFVLGAVVVGRWWSCTPRARPDRVGGSYNILK